MKELKTVLDLQASMAKKQGFISTIVAQIDQQKERIAANQALLLDSVDLQKQYEDLAAKVVLGEANASQLEKLHKEIAAAKTAAEASKEDSAVVGGLERRLEEEQKALSLIKIDHRASIEKLLREEAEKIGAEYLKAAEMVEDRFLRLFRIAQIHQGYRAPGQDDLAATNLRQLFSLPIFRLESHKGQVEGPYSQTTKGTARIKGVCSMDGELLLERERLAAMGIELN